MPRTVTKQVFTFKELNDKAKAKAIEWYRGLNDQDSGWWEFVYDEADRIADAFGITLRRKEAGKPNSGPDIMFTGFWSQGDGACFQGRYESPQTPAVEAFAALGIEDDTLKALAARLDALSAKVRLITTVKHSGHYYHEYCTDFETERMVPDEAGDAFDPYDFEHEDEKELIDILRTFMKWIYRQLEVVEEDRNSDETISEYLTDSDYEFEADGSPTND
ncbi:hypothetical protein HOU02_gp153 [Caulobacter phage CcrBL9]|uniref:Uncharacterized protein n=1 Tax=Caulobacter phage CcrBL9 TaxID=2283270 RepID=A0A385EFF3_9CAUD|nr:hypothetical protein HOU02_gp032 [Caulobacter phage CcrBL9]YP_009810202.1 hypothetical protein HOU02_gp153 [Caulobacter phage CcrBL9]AXQ69056.1 hypothetical protein CcrBL9_gp032 [Caulobacter phage CcrBL9]AXQ69572.1 hypothetical protein CcrBL9_gp548 [Caulobacter phage CcrBL9]